MICAMRKVRWSNTIIYKAISQPEPRGSASSLYTREPAMRKEPARRADFFLVACGGGEEITCYSKTI